MSHFVGTSDPYYEVSYSNDGGRTKTKLGRSDTVNDQENPDWGNTFQLDFDRRKSQVHFKSFIIFLYLRMLVFQQERNFILILYSESKRSIIMINFHWSVLLISVQIIYAVKILSNKTQCKRIYFGSGVG